MTHANAPLTAEGRRRLALLITRDGWSLRRAAERCQCSPATAKRWVDRYRAGLPLTDRSSRPMSCPNRLPRRTERRIIALRFTRRWGPHRIAYHLRLHRSTVGRVLARYAMPLLSHVDQSTGLPVRKPKPRRYEVAAPGQLVHVDIKKQGRTRTVAGGVSTAKGPRNTERLASHADGQLARARLVPGATGISTTRSMTTQGWRTRKSSTMSARRPPPGSGNARTPSSPAWE